MNWCGGSLCLGQRVLDYLVKLLKKELLTEFSPRLGFFPRCLSTFGIFDLRAIICFLMN